MGRRRLATGQALSSTGPLSTSRSASARGRATSAESVAGVTSEWGAEIVEELKSVDAVVPARRIQELALALKNTFEPVVLTHLYPRSEINIYVQVLSMDGGESLLCGTDGEEEETTSLTDLNDDASRPPCLVALLQTAINATTLALLTSGISLLDSLISLTVGTHLETPILDLTAAEESDVPHVVLAFLPRTGRVATAELGGRMSVETFGECLRIGGEGALVLKKEMDCALRKWGGKVASGADGLATGAVPTKAEGRLLDDDEDDMDL